MVYATLQDLATYLEVSEAPAGSQRLLNRASELLDQVTRGQIDTTDAAHLLAAKNAATAQVEYWQAVGEEVSIIGPGIGKIGIGSFKMDGSALPPLAPRALGFLKAAGLWSAAVQQVGRGNAGLAAKFFNTPGEWL